MSAPSSSTLSKPGLLVVDDNPILRGLLGDFFTLCGAPVWQASDGRQALSLMEAQQNRIDMLLLDVVMPRMGGRELLRELRKQNSKVPCCIMTGYVEEHTEQELLDLGATRVFWKPFRSLPTLAEEVFELASESTRFSYTLEESIRESQDGTVKNVKDLINARRPWIPLT